jgi:hypothetical protein
VTLLALETPSSRLGVGFALRDALLRHRTGRVACMLVCPCTARERWIVQVRVAHELCNPGLARTTLASPSRLRHFGGRAPTSRKPFLVLSRRSFVLYSKCEDSGDVLYPNAALRMNSAFSPSFSSRPTPQNPRFFSIPPSQLSLRICVSPAHVLLAHLLQYRRLPRRLSTCCRRRLLLPSGKTLV